MNLSKSKNINENYAAQVIEVKNIRPVPKADRLKMFTFQGNNILSSSVQEGDIVVYFPVECQISPKILSKLNLYRHSEKNEDAEKKGFFEDTGRVKALKLLGVPSEGFVVPVKDFIKVFDNNAYLKVGQVFDSVNGEQVVKKYIIKKDVKTSNGENKTRDKKHPRVSKLVDDQFKLHRDTPKLASNLFKLTENPNNIVTITWKLHGTSFVSSNVLIKKKLGFFPSIFKWLGLPIKTTEYGNLYSSRKVVKNEFFDNKKQHNHYYKVDIWGEVNSQLSEQLIKGETLYGEIVGYLPDGGYIQKGYDYNCEEGKHDVYIYRITQTNEDGKVVELSYDQIAERAEQLGIKVVPLVWQGQVQDLLNTIRIDKSESIAEIGLEETIIEYFKEHWVCDQDSQFCKNRVPEEGICVTLNSLKMPTFKLKSSRFLQHESKELDAGIISVEEEN